MNIKKYNYSTINDHLYCNSYNKLSLRIILWNIAARSSNFISEVIQHVSILDGVVNELARLLFVSELCYAI
jgi:hypothetical protein